jgi:uncharacterized membrane-anchored protein
MTLCEKEVQATLRPGRPAIPLAFSSIIWNYRPMTVRRFLGSLLLFASFATAHAADEGLPTKEQIAEFQRLNQLSSKLQYQTGEISLPAAKAKISLKDGFQYLDRAGAKTLLTDIWRNPPAAAEWIVGMIVPKGFHPLGETSWAVTIESASDGYVKDDEFDSMDFDSVLKEMKEGSKSASKERVAAGYGKMELAGWATTPRYDRAQHKLYWAKKYDVDGPEQTLNYDIRVLGRSGHLELSLISDMSQFSEIEARVPAILSMVDFTDGNRYADYRSGDKVAEYGIAALITGGILTKTGFFKAMLLFLAKGWKLVLIAGVAIGAIIKKIASGRTQRRL